ncbi:hypothetical protein JMY81_07095 [Brenneria goodwinii]|uniref:OmpG porin family protein n=1 Tax=Brenneria goodwinii TaxID=1109412 RepID=UPI000EF175E1|nr:OmpG porin family protein [Brenneria goodwinii]MCG8155772.1 hypothetical protein [Brenneria goodwinii]MCG8160604.1 hypothetical protein [Brenneria goodwinii]MCG8166294.1 hypothetical protein [Brenneria goodwinii]MCG8171144.1 hypothetical protein [Brenneria goodwinii]MCG8176214.1 hypothetical protein [Brenneria goodwinii]
MKNTYLCISLALFAGQAAAAATAENAAEAEQEWPSSNKSTGNWDVAALGTTGQATTTGDKQEDNNVDIARISQEQQSVHWNTVDSSLDAGGLHGNIGSKIEIDDTRWKNNTKNGGKFKLALIQAWLRHDELPGWYFGYWNAREDSYSGQFSNQDYGSTNTINEMYIGKINEFYRGNWGVEVLGGTESASKRWKGRLKLWGESRFTDKWSVSGYIFREYQPQSNDSGNGDLEHHIMEMEPALQYRVNPDLGLYIRPYYSWEKQVRQSWGNIIEEEWKVTAGLWRNWYPLLTSLYVGFGNDKIYNNANRSEVFYNGKYNFIGATASYPIVDNLRLYGEFKAQFTKSYGQWTNEGHSWNPFTIVGIEYSF